MSSEMIDAGTWVELEIEILPAGQRAPQVPPDTAAQPWWARINGRLVEDCRFGELATAETFAGRMVTGTLRAKIGAPPVSFGAPNAHVLAGAAAAVLVTRGLRGEPST